MAEADAPGDAATFYSDLWPAGVRTRLAALPAGAPALAAEIAALRALLRAVLDDADLDAVGRLAAFSKGADSLGRLERLRHQLAPAGGAARAAVDAMLDDLGLGPDTR